MIRKALFIGILLIVLLVTAFGEDHQWSSLEGPYWANGVIAGLKLYQVAVENCTTQV